MFVINPLPAGEVDTGARAVRRVADGPVFVHADGCAPFQPVPDAVSEQVAGRVLSIRAYDEDASTSRGPAASRSESTALRSRPRSSRRPPA